MKQLPRPPVGNHPLVQTIKQLIECVRERTAISGEKVSIDIKNQGTVISARGGVRSGTTNSSGGARWA